MEIEKFTQLIKSLKTLSVESVDVKERTNQIQSILYSNAKGVEFIHSMPNWVFLNPEWVRDDWLDQLDA